MRSAPRRRLRALPFNRLIPNILTVLALSAGLTAIFYGIQGQWQLAVLAILFAGVLDMLDGRVARLLGGASRFGAELDSLSDFVSFGVAPAVLVYLWTLQSAKGIGWGIALVFAICSALRLARFNSRLDDVSDRPAWTQNFFTGVPAPAAGGLVLLPMMLSFEFERALFAHPLVNAPVTIIVALLMISRIPTFGFKRIAVPHRFVVPMLLAVALLAAALVTAIWLTVSAMLIVYLMSIPLSVRAYRRRETMTAGAGPATALDPEHGDRQAFEEVADIDEDDPTDDVDTGAAVGFGSGARRRLTMARNRAGRVVRRVRPPFFRGPR
jgi:CDP-diacylglycerol--serine O-phosphatidyltransferase